MYGAGDSDPSLDDPAGAALRVEVLETSFQDQVLQYKSFW